MTTINYRISMGGGDEARREIVRVGDTAEAQEARMIRAAEAKARKVAELERQMAAARTDADRAFARADAAMGGAGAFAKFEQQERIFREMARQSAQMQKEQQQAANDAKRLLAAIDPLYGAQNRYNVEMAEANRLYKAGALSVDQFTVAQRHAKAALDAATAAANRNGVSVGQVGAASRNLGYQVTDITQQIALGTPAMMIFAQQSGQVTQALGALGVGGALGRVLAFMSGPWGAAVTGGAMILAMFASRTKDADAASKTFARTSEEVADRLNVQKHGIDAVNAALREMIKEKEKAAELEWQEAERIAAGTRILIERAVAIREVTRARLADQMASESMTDAEGAAGATAYAGAISRSLANQDSQIALLNTYLRQNEAITARNNADRRNDPAKGINDRVDADIEALRRAYVSGNRSYSRDAKQLEDQITALNVQRKRELDTIREQEKALKSKADTGAAEMVNFVQPVQGGRQTSGYGYRAAPTKGASTFHQAIDFAAPEGTPVVSAAGGYIEVVGYSRGHGKYIIVNHGAGTRTKYNHLSAAIGDKGDVVEAGQMIGRVGSTGVSTGPHLDFQVYRGNKLVNPSAMRFPIGQVAIDKAAAKDAADQVREDAERLRELRASYDRLLSSLNPVAAASKEVADQQERIAALVKAGPDKGGITAAEGRSLSIAATVEGIRKEMAAAGVEPVDRNAADRLQEVEETERRKSEWAKRALEDDDARTQMLERQLQLVGANDNERRSEMLKMQTILELQRQGIDAESARGQEIIASRLAVDELEKSLDRATQLQDDFRRIGEGALDSIFNPSNWNNWGDVGKSILKELEAEFIKLALLNPLKNMLYGQNNATFGDLFGMFGGGGGSGIVAGDTPWLKLPIPGNAMGTENWRGGWTWLGENGPELGYLPPASKVLTAAQSRRVASGNDNGMTINMPISIDATGADSAGLARVEAQLADLRQSLPSTIVATVQEARSRNLLQAA